MDKTGVDLLNLMFRAGENICVSHNKYAFHSIPLTEAVKKTVTLVPVDPQRPFEYVSSDKITLVSLNPITGFRQDANCIAFRNFLVEMDYGTSEAQLEYAKLQNLPYSAVVFSGNKSLHFLISLDTDLPNEEVWRDFAQWTLSIMTMADQATKNPSRSIRIPGAEREPGKLQKLVEYKGPIKVTDFYDWLQMHPDEKPRKAERRVPAGTADYSNLREWAVKALTQGLNPNKGRNVQWFAIACEFALAGYDEETATDIMSEYFTPDRDFKEREWKDLIRSAFKYIYDNRMEPK